MKTAMVGTPGLNQAEVDIPATAAQAAANFRCAPTRCTMSGRACALRHRRHASAPSLSACGTCPAGESRLVLIGDTLNQRPEPSHNEKLLALGESNRQALRDAVMRVMHGADRPLRHCEVLSALKSSKSTSSRLSAALLHLIDAKRIVRLTNGTRSAYTLAKTEEVTAPTAPPERATEQDMAKKNTSVAPVTIADFHQQLIALGPCTQAAVSKVLGLSSTKASGLCTQLVKMGAAVKRKDDRLYEAVEDFDLEAPSTPAKAKPLAVPPPPNVAQADSAKEPTALSPFAALQQFIAVKPRTTCEVAEYQQVSASMAVKRLRTIGAQEMVDGWVLNDEPTTNAVPPPSDAADRLLNRLAKRFDINAVGFHPDSLAGVVEGKVVETITKLAESNATIAIHERRSDSVAHWRSEAVRWQAAAEGKGQHIDLLQLAELAGLDEPQDVDTMIDAIRGRIEAGEQSSRIVDLVKADFSELRKAVSLDGEAAGPEVIKAAVDLIHGQAKSHIGRIMNAAKMRDLLGIAKDAPLTIVDIEDRALQGLEEAAAANGLLRDLRVQAGVDDSGPLLGRVISLKRMAEDFVTVRNAVFPDRASPHQAVTGVKAVLTEVECRQFELEDLRTFKRKVAGERMQFGRVLTLLGLPDDEASHAFDRIQQLHRTIQRMSAGQHRLLDLIAYMARKHGERELEALDAGAPASMTAPSISNLPKAG